MFLFIGGTEVIFILFIVVMVFGANKIPEIARGLGKGMRQLKDATNEIKHEIQKSADIHIDKEIADEINEGIDSVTKDVNSIKNSIKRDL